MTTMIAALLVLSAPAPAADESPPARVTQQVGLTEIAVEYGSPAVRGRAIWGAAVPWDKPWSICPGQPPTIRFSKDVTAGGQPVPAGSYRLRAVPGRERWTFVLEPGAIRLEAQVHPAPHRERLTFMFSDFTDDEATLDLEWEKLRVSLRIATASTREVLRAISELDTTWRSYANAARFMLEKEKDFDAGLRYANQSLALKEDWYTLWIKAALLAAKHDYKAAVENGRRAYDLGQRLGDAFVLQPDLEKALAEWSRKAGAKGSSK